MPVHVYNCTTSTATGQKPQVLVDLYFGTQKVDMNAATSTRFVQQLCESLKCTYKTAQQIIEKENQRHKQNYDHQIRCNQSRVGDQVLLRRKPLKADIRFRIIGKILCIMLRGNHMMECQFSGSPQLHREAS